MIVRYLEYLTALAHERHFARAAEVCHVTQPTLSAGIKQLEESLGVLIVERRHRFVGFTPEGERVLAWARRILADYTGLEQELSELKEGLAGQLRIGAIPVTLQVVGLLTAAFSARYPRSRFTILSQTSIEIQRGLDEFVIDVGLTYLDNEPLARVQTHPLYSERYVVMSRRDGPFAGRSSASWAEVARLPLCLLTPTMQNRRILDMHFHEAGVRVDPIVETNSLITLWSHLWFGNCATVVPHTFALLLGEFDNFVATPLIEPEAHHVVGLVASIHEPVPPLVQGFLAHARQREFALEIERQLVQVNAHRRP